MADLPDGLAQYLAVRGHGTYDPTGTTGDMFVEAMPSTPDTCVVLTQYGGPESDSLLPYDEPRVQVRVRGTTDPRVSRARAEAIRSELHGLTAVTLPDGTELISAIAMQPVASLGVDDNRRHEHVVNFRTEIRNPTAHRT